MNNLWISYGYDGAIAGTFLVMHRDRPLPEKIGVEVITEMKEDGTYDGSLADGVISVKRFKQFLLEFESDAKALDMVAWQRFIQEHLDEQIPRKIENIMVESRKKRYNPYDFDEKWMEMIESKCKWCGGRNGSHIQGCLEE